MSYASVVECLLGRALSCEITFSHVRVPKLLVGERIMQCFDVNFLRQRASVKDVSGDDNIVDLIHYIICSWSNNSMFSKCSHSNNGVSLTNSFGLHSVGFT